MIALHREPVPLESVLTERSSFSRSRLKRRLYEQGLKQRHRELCGQGEEWRGRRMASILDHVNGIGDDKRCEAPYFPTHREQRYCSRACGSASPRSRAATVAPRRIERPPEVQLREDVAALGYSAVGRRYGVSDNAIRKWLRFYERQRAEGE